MYLRQVIYAETEKKESEVRKHLVKTVLPKIEEIANANFRNVLVKDSKDVVLAIQSRLKYISSMGINLHTGVLLRRGADGQPTRNTLMLNIEVYVEDEKAHEALVEFEELLSSVINRLERALSSFKPAYTIIRGEAAGRTYLQNVKPAKIGGA